MTDEELMAAHIGGDRASFALLFERWAPRLHGFFLRATGDSATAEDLLQQTFLKAHRGRDSFGPPRILKSWLFSIAAHSLKDELRRRKRAPLEEDAATERELEGAGDSQQLLESRERALAVRAAIDRLPETQRSVLYLHRFEQMSFGEVATALGTTEGAVRLRAFRAYQQLRQALLPLVQERT